jgi:hypothetical protein
LLVLAERFREQAPTVTQVLPAGSILLLIYSVTVAEVELKVLEIPPVVAVVQQDMLLPGEMADLHLSILLEVVQQARQEAQQLRHLFLEG